MCVCMCACMYMHACICIYTCVGVEKAEGRKGHAMMHADFSNSSHHAHFKLIGGEGTKAQKFIGGEGTKVHGRRGYTSSLAARAQKLAARAQKFTEQRETWLAARTRNVMSACSSK